MKKIINGKVYNTETAILIADNKYWDGNNWDRKGRSQSLYKTQKGNFFLYNETRWQGEFDNIEPISKEYAMNTYEILEEQRVSYEDAFGIIPEEG